MRMSWKEAFYVTINASLLAIMYTVFGALISYVFYHIFDEFNDFVKIEYFLMMKDKSLVG